jgi:alpha-glucosidase (family GH31 glycosyl hydrolase)
MIQFPDHLIYNALVHWGGDCESTWEAMAEALRGALSLTTSGFAFASHDIGGFEGHPDPQIYQRWVAFGLFSSHSRLHGSASYRIPWQYGEDAAKSMSKFVDAKHRLMPYLYNLVLPIFFGFYFQSRLIVYIGGASALERTSSAKSDVPGVLGR